MRDALQDPFDTATKRENLPSIDSATCPSSDTAPIGRSRQHAHHRPSWPKWVMLVATIAVVASMGCIVSREKGIQYVEVTEEMELLVISEEIQFGSPIHPASYSSPDSGLTWTLEANEPETIPEFNLDVATPRGHYVLEGTEVVLIGPENERLTTYSSAYLQQPGNMWVQQEETTGFGSNRVLASEPLSIAHDPTTGNVIAAMGLQGVIVGTPDGQWQRVAVGPYTPTDFSFVSKSEKFLTYLPFWLASIALTLSMLALSLFFSQLSKRRLRISLLTFISSLIGISMLILVATGFIEIPYLFSYVLLFLLVFPVTLVILAVILTALKSSSALSRSITGALLGVPSVGLASGAILASGEPGGGLVIIIFCPIVYVLVGLLLLVSGQDLVGYGTVSRFLIATNGLVLLSFMVWLHSGIQTWVAVVVAVTLTAAATIVYTAYLRSRNKPDDDPFIDSRPGLTLRSDSAPPLSE